MDTDPLQRALDELGAAEARTRACERGSAERAVAVIDEERASKAVWDAAAGGALDRPRPVTPHGRSTGAIDDNDGSADVGTTTPHHRLARC